MSCPCNKPVEFPKGKKCDANTPPVLQINSKECPVLFHTVNIPAAAGDVNSIPPTAGDYKNTRVYYEANRMSYLYDSDGIPQILSGTGLPEVTSVNSMAGDVVITLESLGGASTTALEDEASAREDADDALSDDLDELSGTVADNTAAIAEKADADDVYTKAEVDDIVEHIGETIHVPSTYWGQSAVGDRVSGDITFLTGEGLTWGENNPSLTGSNAAAITLRSGTTAASGPYSQLAVDRTGIVLNHYESGEWTGTAKISGVDDGTAANDAVNLSQITSGTWNNIGDGSSYNKAGSVVSVQIAEQISPDGTDPVTVFTLPAGFRPSTTCYGTAVIDDSTNTTVVPAVVTVGTDGIVQIATTYTGTDLVTIGSITFLI